MPILKLNPLHNCNYNCNYDTKFGVGGHVYPVSRNRTQPRAGRPKHAQKCAPSMSSWRLRGPWGGGRLSRIPREGRMPFSEPWVMCPWWPRGLFSASGDVFCHYFGLVASVTIAIPIFPGVVIIKHALTASWDPKQNPEDAAISGPKLHVVRPNGLNYVFWLR